MSEKIPYKPPQNNETAYNCPFCNAYASQSWQPIFYRSGSLQQLAANYITICSHCRKYAIWLDEKMIYPDLSTIEPANTDLSDDIKFDYAEAAAILQKSPRGAAALLRLALQKMCNELGEKGKIDTMIANLVKKGLPIGVQEALDLVRVIGNDAVHPGQIDIKDDVETASKLFRLINFITEKMVTEPNEIKGLFETKIPESKKKAIEVRDAK